MDKKIFKFLPIAMSLSLSSIAFADMSNTVTSDQDVAKKVNERIGAGWFTEGYKNVHAEVQNGVVTLSGFVKTNADKEKVEREVRNISGVTNVESKVRVEDPESVKESNYPQDSYGTYLDEQLNKKIRDKVSNGWLWDSYTDVSLNTTNGVVTLEGKVKDTKDQQKIMQEIQRVPGVKSVKSNLRIER